LQYSNKRTNIKPCRPPLLNFVKANRREMHCTGIAFCRYLIPELRDFQHCEVTPEMLRYLAQERKRLHKFDDSNFGNVKKINAEK
jgi:hypothetical protein